MYVPFLLLAIAFQSSESLYEAPKDLSKVNSKVFELLTEKSGYEVRLAEWRKKIDNEKYCKDETIVRFCDLLKCPLRINPKIVKVGREAHIDSIGLAIAEGLFEKDKAFWEKVRGKVTEQCSGTGVDSAVNRLADIVLEVRRTRRFGIEQQITAFAEIVAETSPESGKLELWMLVEFSLSPSNFDAYARAEYKRLLAMQGDLPLAFLPPHPWLAKITRLTLEHSKTALEANREDNLARFRLLPEFKDDGLTALDRQNSLGFVVIDDRDLEQHQMEGVSFGSLTPAGWEGAAEVLRGRIPNGRVLSVAEINAYCGEFCKNYRKSTGEKEVRIVFRLLPYELGPHVYSRLRVEFKP